MNVNTVEIDNYLDDYSKVLTQLNDEYCSNLYILSETEFKDAPIYSDYHSDYSNYTNSILKTDLATLYLSI